MLSVECVAFLFQEEPQKDGREPLMGKCERAREESEGGRRQEEEEEEAGS